MIVLNQKNVYYIDLNKNVFKGYIETDILRESNERFIVYRSTHLEIEKIQLVEKENRELTAEFYNSKAAKDKGKIFKTPKIVISKKLNQDSSPSLDQSPKNDNSVLEGCTNPCLEEARNKTIGKSPSEDSYEHKFFENAPQLFDSFKVKLPADLEDLEIKVRIIFKPSEKNPAILWYRPISDLDKHKEIIALNISDNSSFIAPFVDAVANFDLYFIIPNTEEVKVVSSGTFKSIKEEDKTIVYLYTVCCHPKYLMFAAGTYDQNDIFNDNDKRKILTPCSIESDTTEVSNDLQSIIKYIESFTKTVDLSTCNVLFSLINIDNVVAKNLIVLNYSLFPSNRDIEISYLLKRILCECLSLQVYHFLNWSVYDMWIKQGLSGYLCDYCLRYILGMNEFYYNFYEDKKFIVKNDVVEPPLFYTFRKESECNSEFFMKKSKLLFHCMESHLSFAFLQKISDEMLEARKIKFETINNRETVCQEYYPGLKRCFTTQFMKIIKDATGKDLKSFFDFYLFRPGLMEVKITFQINKKKNSVKAVMSTTPTSILPGANKKFLGNIDLKSYELEGNFDHLINVESEAFFMYHTRTKKKKKEDEEEVMPLLFIRVDPKRMNLFNYTIEQPDYMYIEQLQEKDVIGQLEAVENLKSKPTISSCEALERLLDNNHIYYKIRIKIAYVLRSTYIEGYDGLQKIVQYFIRNRCVPNSTILKGNEFGLIPYFVQKHIVKSIAIINTENENFIKDTKIIIAFLENILKFNDNSLSQFEDSWYISSVINLFCLHTIILTSQKTDLNHSSFLSLNNPNEYFKSGFSKLTEEASRFDDFFRSEPVEKKIKSTAPQPDYTEAVEKCIDELERFRVSDMVFPSNNNIITRTCLLSYVRLAYYNKIRISKQALQNLAAFPNLLSIRCVAIEGLLLLFSDSLEFILSSIVKEEPFCICTVFEIILRVVSLDIRVHFQDTDEYDANLTERILVQLKNNLNILIEIFKVHYFNLKLLELIRKLILLMDNRKILTANIQDHCLYKFDFNKEESSRISLLKVPSTTKKLKIANFEGLRIAALESNYILRIPRIKNYKPKPLKEVSTKVFKIKIKPTRFLIKHWNFLLIRFKLSRTKLKVRKSDVPLILITKYRENKNSIAVDDFIRKTKPTGFFNWTPLTSKQLLDQRRETYSSLKDVYIELERSLIFALSYNTIISKVYLTSKALFNYLESILYQNCFIIEKLAPMTPILKEKCLDFINKVNMIPEFEPFYYPVDTTELRNYVDIVRYPISFYDLKDKMEKFGSFDCFIAQFERIYINCINYNECRSLIVESALLLKKEIDEFKAGITLEYVNSMDVIKGIVQENNTENLLDDLITSTDSINTWGELEEAFNELKKKYSRSSNNGKTILKCIKSIKDSLKYWFFIDNGRVFMISD